jgi:hypothetical protein
MPAAWRSNHFPGWPKRSARCHACIAIFGRCMSLRQFRGIWMGRSSAQGNSTGLPGESRWRTKASVIAREQFLSTFGQCNDSIISSWLGSAATAEQIERIAQANRRTISSFGEPDRHCIRTRGCKAVAQAAQAWMATSNRFSGAPRKHWCCAGGLVSEPHFSEHCIG